MSVDDKRLELVGEGLLTVVEACAFLRVSRSWLYSAMEAGLVSYVRLAEDGRRGARRIPKRALVELAARLLVGREN